MPVLINTPILCNGGVTIRVSSKQQSMIYPVFFSYSYRQQSFVRDMAAYVGAEGVQNMGRS
jgi:hypothetical protein